MNIINSALDYFKGSYRELSKVSWPSRQEVVWLTSLVVIIILAAAVVLALIDFGLASLINYLLSLSTK